MDKAITRMRRRSFLRSWTRKTLANTMSRILETRFHCDHASGGYSANREVTVNQIQRARRHPVAKFQMNGLRSFVNTRPTRVAIPAINANGMCAENPHVSLCGFM